MTYLLWTLLNVAVVFIVICFRTVKLVGEKIGTLAALFLAFGLFAFARKHGEQTELLVPRSNDPTQFIPIQASISNSFNSGYSKAALAAYVGTELNMEVSFSKDTDGMKTQVDKVSFSFEGFVGGHKWEPTSVRIYPSTGRESSKFEIDGRLRWTLLGITLYTQTKHFLGSVDLK